MVLLCFLRENGAREGPFPHTTSISAKFELPTLKLKNFKFRRFVDVASPEVFLAFGNGFNGYACCGSACVM
jgi:hypothetical protein